MFLILLLLILLFLIQTALELKDREKTTSFDFIENCLGEMVKKINDGTLDANEKLNLLLKIEKDNTINNIIVENNVKIKIALDVLNKMIIDYKEVKQIIENNYLDLSSKIENIDKSLITLNK